MLLTVWEKIHDLEADTLIVRINRGRALKFLFHCVILRFPGDTSMNKTKMTRFFLQGLRQVSYGYLY